MNPCDTIVAVSSPSGGVRTILRVTGPHAFSVCRRIADPQAASQIQNLKSEIPNSHIISGSVCLQGDLAVDARLYLFFSPHSYTGEDLLEIHVNASRVIVEALLQDLLREGLRPAEPGEFTARAYLNGKLDLAQAEAVNEIIVGSNRLQLDAAQRLLRGRLTQAADEIRSDLLDILSLIEAGLDFSSEDIEFISTRQAVERLTGVQGKLEELLAGSIRCETVIDLPAIGIAGAPNAGKSSLLNALLGWERSIVSEQPKTTRDVLSGVLTTNFLQCVLFDCAGLLPMTRPFSHNLHAESPGCIDELAQQAATEALQNCHTVLFCVDCAKQDWSEDLAVRALIQPKNVIYVATKSDLSRSNESPVKLAALAKAFDAEFLAVSVKTSHGLDSLLDAIKTSIVGWAVPTTPHPCSENSGGAILIARHKQAITEAIDGIRQSIDQVRQGNDEIGVTMIRAACQAISQIEQQPIDEQILDRIFSRFCIGK
jgi:tRNA modification GTPase